MQYIMTQVQFGWLIRSIHSWSANLMIFTAFAHMFSVLFLKAYRKPRELTWVSGVILLFLVMGFGFSGYLLPWNTLAFFATKVGTEITGQVPIIGKPLMIFLRGGEDVTGATLSRFFGFHVAVLPGVGNGADSCAPAFGSAAGHQRASEAGGAVDRESVCEAGNEIFPQLHAAGNDGLVRSPGSARALAALFPVESRSQGRSFCVGTSGNQAGVVLPLHVPDAEAYSSQVWFIDGEVLGVLVFGVVALLWLLLPFLESDHPSRTKRWITGAAVFALAYVAGMSLYGHLAK